MTLTLVTLEKFRSAFEKYLELFKAADKVTSVDVYLFAHSIKRCAELRHIVEGLNLCKVIEDKLTKNENPDVEREGIIIYYWCSYLHYTSNNRQFSIKYADLTLELVRNSKGKTFSVIDDKGLADIEQQMLQIKKSFEFRVPKVAAKKYGRNDKVKVEYKEGVIIEKKFKLIEADVVSGKCKIIEN